MITNTLLIYETNPERTDLYLIPNDVLTNDARRSLIAAQNKLINGEKMNDGMEDILNMLDKENKNGWSKYKRNNDEPIEDITIDHVYYTGFIL